jgi:hypothetical protein
MSTTPPTQELEYVTPLELNSILRTELIESAVKQDSSICPTINKLGNHLDQIDELSVFLADVLYDLMPDMGSAEWLNQQIYKEVHNVTLEFKVRMEIFKKLYDNKTIDLLITNKWLSSLFEVDFNFSLKYIQEITYVIMYMIENMDEFDDTLWDNLEALFEIDFDGAFEFIVCILRVNPTIFQEKIDSIISMCTSCEHPSLPLVKLLYEHEIAIPCKLVHILIQFKRIDALEYLHEKHVDVLKLTANIEFEEEEAKWSTLLEKLGFTLSDYLRLNSSYEF